LLSLFLTFHNQNKVACVSEVGGFLKPPPPSIMMAINSSHALSRLGMFVLTICSCGGNTFGQHFTPFAPWTIIISCRFANLSSRHPACCSALCLLRTATGPHCHLCGVHRPTVSISYRPVSQSSFDKSTPGSWARPPYIVGLD
jgi:hypothetical protein